MNKRIIAIIACFLCAFIITGTAFALNIPETTNYGNSGVISAVSFDKAANTIEVKFSEEMNPGTFGMGLNCAKAWTKTWNEANTALTISDIDLSSNANPTLIIYIMQTAAEKKDIVEPNIFLMSDAVGPDLVVRTDANLIKDGEYFRVTANFAEEVKSNTAILNYTFDTSKFDYHHFTPADGVQMISQEATETGAKVVVMVQGYKTTDYGEVLLSAKDDAGLTKEIYEVAVKVDYVVINVKGEKEIRQAFISKLFTTTDDLGSNPDGKYTLIDLSNLIDMFGKNSDDSDWDTCRFYDFNGNGEIDTHDISTLAQKI